MGNFSSNYKIQTSSVQRFWGNGGWVASYGFDIFIGNFHLGSSLRLFWKPRVTATGQNTVQSRTMVFKQDKSFFYIPNDD